MFKIPWVFSEYLFTVGLFSQNPEKVHVFVFVVQTRSLSWSWTGSPPLARWWDQVSQDLSNACCGFPGPLLEEGRRQPHPGSRLLLWFLVFWFHFGDLPGPRHAGHSPSTGGQQGGPKLYLLFTLKAGCACVNIRPSRNRVRSPNKNSKWNLNIL